MSSQDSARSYIGKLGVSMSSQDTWLDIDTPNVRMYDRALSWLDIDTPDVRMYHRALSWLDIDVRGIDVKPG
jgi:hypothetical protein